MPQLSARSRGILATCDPRLVEVVEAAIVYFDFTVLEGHRDEEAQMRAYARGVSKVKWPNSKHNKLLSEAVDLAPYPIDWSNEIAALERFALLAGVILVVSKQLGVDIRWGGDWDGDLDTRDERGLRDRPHFELRLA